MSKFIRMQNGLVINKCLPTTSRRSDTGHRATDLDALDALLPDNWHKHKRVRVISVDKQIITNHAKIPESDQSLGGTVVTGFLDVEKLIEVKEKHHREKRIFFLEKVLPFQILELELEKTHHHEEREES